MFIAKVREVSPKYFYYDNHKRFWIQFIQNKAKLLFSSPRIVAIFGTNLKVVHSGCLLSDHLSHVVD